MASCKVDDCPCVASGGDGYCAVHRHLSRGPDLSTPWIEPDPPSTESKRAGLVREDDGTGYVRYVEPPKPKRGKRYWKGEAAYWKRTALLERGTAAAFVEGLDEAVKERDAAIDETHRWKAAVDEAIVQRDAARVELATATEDRGGVDGLQEARFDRVVKERDDARHDLKREVALRTRTEAMLVDARKERDEAIRAEHVTRRDEARERTNTGDKATIQQLHSELCRSQEQVVTLTAQLDSARACIREASDDAENSVCSSRA